MVSHFAELGSGPQAFPLAQVVSRVPGLQIREQTWAALLCSAYREVPSECRFQTKGGAWHPALRGLQPAATWGN